MVGRSSSWREIMIVNLIEHVRKLIMTMTGTKQAPTNTPKSQVHPEASTKIYVHSGSPLLRRTARDLENLGLTVQVLTGSPRKKLRAGDQIRLSGSWKAMNALRSKYF
jgi:hypothetical protein